MNVSYNPDEQLIFNIMGNSEEMTKVLDEGNVDKAFTILNQVKNSLRETSTPMIKMMIRNEIAVMGWQIGKKLEKDEAIDKVKNIVNDLSIFSPTLPLTKKQNLISHFDKYMTPSNKDIFLNTTSEIENNSSEENKKSEEPSPTKTQQKDLEKEQIQQEQEQIQLNYAEFLSKKQK